MLSKVLTTWVGIPPLSNWATWVESEWDAAVVEFAPLVAPVNVVDVVPV